MSQLDRSKNTARFISNLTALFRSSRGRENRTSKRQSTGIPVLVERVEDRTLLSSISIEPEQPQGPKAPALGSYLPTNTQLSLIHI